MSPGQRAPVVTSTSTETAISSAIQWIQSGKSKWINGLNNSFVPSIFLIFILVHCHFCLCVYIYIYTNINICGVYCLLDKRQAFLDDKRLDICVSIFYYPLHYMICYDDGNSPRIQQLSTRSMDLVLTRPVLILGSWIINWFVVRW